LARETAEFIDACRAVIARVCVLLAFIDVNADGSFLVWFVPGSACQLCGGHTVVTSFRVETRESVITHRVVGNTFVYIFTEES